MSLRLCAGTAWVVKSSKNLFPIDLREFTLQASSGQMLRQSEIAGQTYTARTEFA